MFQWIVKLITGYFGNHYSNKIMIIIAILNIKSCTRAITIFHRVDNYLGHAVSLKTHLHIFRIVHYIYSIYRYKHIMMYIYAHVFIAIDLYVRAIFEITTLFMITENNSLKIESKVVIVCCRSFFACPRRSFIIDG